MLEDNQPVYGVVDLYGRVMKVSMYEGQIIKPLDSDSHHNLRDMEDKIAKNVLAEHMIHDVPEAMSILTQIMSTDTAEESDVVLYCAIQ